MGEGPGMGAEDPKWGEAGWGAAWLLFKPDIILQPEQVKNISLPYNFMSPENIDRIRRPDGIKEGPIKPAGVLVFITQSNIISIGAFQQGSPDPVNPVIFMDPFQLSQGIDMLM